ncbi:hypothetical protein M0657_011193 [Pyricularia oryzae]|nr:hypothetical protein M0657_011193 [Pyricularia oryzae]
MDQLAQRCSDKIFTWLEQVVPPSPGPPSTSTQFKKRKRSKLPTTDLYASPPSSTSTASAACSMDTRTPTKRKRRATATENDLEATPRRGDYQTSSILAAPRLFTTPQQTWELSSVHSSTTSGASSKSGQFSPSKELARLALGPGALVTKTLALTELLPPKLFDTLKTITSIQEGSVGIFPERLKETIERESEARRTFDVYPHMFVQDEGRDLLGPTPSVSEVIDIVEDARRCNSRSEYEDGWISGVHFPLLRLALNGKRGPGSELLEVLVTTHAKALRRYITVDGHRLRMVDLCVVACPSNQPVDPTAVAAKKAIDVLREKLPGSSINHSDAPPLLDVPIALSIEVKRGGGDEKRQTLQIGTWQAAQWNMWSQLLEGRFLQKYAEVSTSETPTGEDSGGTPAERAVAESDRLLCTLPYLPAIFIRGHSWHLAATSRQGDKTILWHEYAFGTTQSVVGTYKIISGLQSLQRYIRDVFWPWYLRVILEIEH